VLAEAGKLAFVEGDNCIAGSAGTGVEVGLGIADGQRRPIPVAL
jgi:hypothetical protein